jgi:hypothetical protein
LTQQNRPGICSLKEPRILTHREQTSTVFKLSKKGPVEKGRATTQNREEPSHHTKTQQQLQQRGRSKTRGDPLTRKIIVIRIEGRSLFILLG